MQAHVRTDLHASILGSSCTSKNPLIPLKRGPVRGIHMRGKDKRTGGTALLFPTQGSLGTNTQMDGWDGMGQGTHVCSVHAKKMHHALPLCSVEKGKASCRCGTTKRNGMTRACQNERRTAPRRFSASRESHGTKVRWARLKWIGAKKGGKEGWEWDGCRRRVTHTHTGLFSLSHTRVVKRKSRF